MRTNKLMFAFLEINDSIRLLETMPSTVNTADTCDHVSLDILCVSPADCIETGSASIDLIEKIDSLP